MLRFILTGLCLLQFQVAFTSYVCRGSKFACPTGDPTSSNDIRDDPFCSKHPKETFLIFQPKPLHRFHPFFCRQPNFNAPILFKTPQNPISTPVDLEKRITDFCGIKSKEVSQVKSVPEVQMEVENPPSDPKEPVFEEESSKQYSTPVDSQGGDSEDLSCEPMPKDAMMTSSDPCLVDNEGQEEQSSLNPSDSNAFAQCPPGQLNYVPSLFNPSALNSETDKGISTPSTEDIQSVYDAYASKLGESSEQAEGSAEPDGSSAEPEGSSAEPEGSSAEPEGSSAEPEGSSAEPEGSSCTTQIIPETIDEEVSVEPICAQQEIPQPQSIPLDTVFENVSSANAVDNDESSNSQFETECVSPTTEQIAKESFSGTTLPSVTNLCQISCNKESPEINKMITENQVSTLTNNQCTHVLTGRSLISTKTSPSLVKPIYEEVIHHVPTIGNVVRHRLVETTHRVPIVERIIQHERHDIIRHIPVVQKVTRNVVECITKHIPIIKLRKRTVEEPYIDHVPRTQKISRPVIETLVKDVPVVFSRYKPVLHQRIRHVPTVETRCIPVVEETVTTVPANILASPSSDVSYGLGHLCKY